MRVLAVGRVLLAGLAACASTEEEEHAAPDVASEHAPDEAEPEPGPPAEVEPPLDPIWALRLAAEDLYAREEHTAEQVTVQHLLVSFAGSGTRATRTRGEAEALAAELWARIQAGEDFDELVEDHTDDSAPGIYAMVDGGTARPPETYPRRSMVAAFGDIGWRLEVGEFGVAAHDEGSSPYGWHLIKRVE